VCVARARSYSAELTLTNTSAIPLPYMWRMSDEGPTGREFAILPARGTVLPHGRSKIRVEFQPQTVQHYSLSLFMDMPGVGERVLALPVTGECAVPLLRVKEEQVDLGQCFLNYPYQGTFTLVNDSKLPAKFEVLAQVGQYSSKQDRNKWLLCYMQTMYTCPCLQLMFVCLCTECTAALPGPGTADAVPFIWRTPSLTDPTLLGFPLPPGPSEPEPSHLHAQPRSCHHPSQGRAGHHAHGAPGAHPHPCARARDGQPQQAAAAAAGRALRGAEPGVC
jgi:hypothetical protein